MVDVLTFITLLVLLLLRTVRLVAWVQQKEYRWDRLWLFFQTAEGKFELVRLVPSLSELVRFRFKRPHQTVRALITSGLCIIVEGVAIFTFTAWMGLASAMLILLCVLPIIVVLVGVVPSLGKEGYTNWLLSSAQKKVQKINPFIIGITGSFGKTSTKLLLSHVLSQYDAVFFTPASFNTPLSVAQSILKGFSDQQLMILEFAAYKKGEIARLVRFFTPQLVILTGLTDQHVGLFGSRAAIGQAKAELVTHLESRSTVILGSESATEILQAAGKSDARIKHAQSVAITGSLTTAGYLQITCEKKTWTTQLVGMHSLALVQTVAVAAEACGLPLTECCVRIAAFTPSAHFLRIRKLASGAECIDDSGTSNQVGFEAALAVLAQRKESRTIVIFSGIVDLGVHSEGIHAKLAQQVGKLGAECWYVGTAGKETFVKILGSACVTDENEIQKKMPKLKPGDTVLLEGRMPSWIAL
ncbi:hypothetical protein KA078_02900 [Candidatus Woesebacteria bacterium]|nr:hypothetical protein [Candidatus Woesebacteria bacterium]